MHIFKNVITGKYYQNDELASAFSYRVDTDNINDATKMVMTTAIQGYEPIDYLEEFNKIRKQKLKNLKNYGSK